MSVKYEKQRSVFSIVDLVSVDYRDVNEDNVECGLLSEYSTAL